MSHPVDDITNRGEIADLLTDFYGRAFRDDLLGPVFVDVARLNLADHLPVMCDFWETVLFHSGQYRRNALHPHMRLSTKTPLTPAHFERWLMLWKATVDDRHTGASAELAKLQATRIAGSMGRRITGVSGLAGGHPRRCATSAGKSSYAARTSSMSTMSGRSTAS